MELLQVPALVHVHQAMTRTQASSPRHKNACTKPRLPSLLCCSQMGIVRGTACHQERDVCCRQCVWFLRLSPSLTKMRYSVGTRLQMRSLVVPTSSPFCRAGLPSMWVELARRFWPSCERSISLI